MSTANNPWLLPFPTTDDPTKLRNGLYVLLQHWNCAAATGDPDALWQFSVSLSELQRLGLTLAEVQWLIYQGFVLHAKEITKEGGARRQFTEIKHLHLEPDQCFVLTENGTRLAHDLAQPPPTPKPMPGASELTDEHSPRWLAQSRQLYLGSHLVKTFTTQADNQILVISAFAEEGWPSCIDDPLPRDHKSHDSMRLRNTVRRLNQKQQCALLCFHTVNKGQGISWERLDS